MSDQLAKRQCCHSAGTLDPGHRSAGATLAKPPGVTGPLGGPI